MLDVKKTLAHVLKNAFRIKEIPQGASVSDLVALPTGIYSNTNATSNLPTQYGTLLVIDGGHYKAYAYFSTERGISYAINTPASTSFSWINLSGYMRVYSSANQTLPQGTTTLNLNTVGASFGNGLTLNSSTHEVVVGDGVHLVQVSASVYVYSLGTAGAKNITIQRNGTTVVRTVANLTNNYNTLSIPAFIFGVSKGDKIRMVAISNNGSTTVINGGGETWMLVRVVA